MPLASDSSALPPISLEMDTLGSEPDGARAKPPTPTTAPPNRKDYVLGLALLLLVVFLWTTSNFVTQNLFINGYEKPFLVTYLNTSSFAFYLIPYFIRYLRRRGRDADASSDPGKDLVGSAEERQPLAALDSIDEQGDEISSSRLVPPTTPNEGGEESLPPLTVRQTAELALAFCLLWFIANWSVNAALDYTTVASATILTSTSGFFTLGVGRIFKVEKLTALKIAAVFTSFFGVILVSLSDSYQTPNPASQLPTTNSLTANFEHAPQPLLGDSLALISALFYALYVILLKVRVKNEGRMDMQLFFGFVGLLNVLMCWPLGFVLHWTGVEPFELPTKATEWYAIFVNMAITLSSDYLYVLAMLKTTPLVVTVGISLTIPVAVLGDFILHVPVRAQVLAGAALVLLSFIAIGSDKSNTNDATRRDVDN